MGLPNSKFCKKNDLKTSEASLPSTPISTPKANFLDIDPRSPTANIYRTPIVQDSTDKNSTETPIVGVLNSSISEDQVYIDPRSPSVEFTRTPIVSTTNIKIRNKNLDLVKRELLNFSPMKPHGTGINVIKNSKPKSEIKINQGPILLGSNSVVKQKILQTEKRKSYVGFLETNLDFVETDLDSIIKKSYQKQLKIEKSIEDENILKEEQEIYNILLDDNTEEITENRSIVVEDLPTKEEIISSIEQTLEKINQIDTETKNIITNSQQIEIDYEDDEIRCNAFEKKVTNLIYKDDNTILPNLPKATIKTLTTNNGNRTPLGERNDLKHLSSNKKSIRKLKVNDKPLKDYTVSKIPIFKEKKGKNKLTQQCENTPPRQMVEHKTQKPQWDADKTMII